MKWILNSTIASITHARTNNDWIVIKFINIWTNKCWTDQSWLIIHRCTLYSQSSNKLQPHQHQNKKHLFNEFCYLYNIVLSNQIIVNIFSVTDINSFINKKNCTLIHSIQLFLYNRILSLLKYSPSTNRYGFILESIALNWWIFTPLWLKELFSAL